MPRAKKAMCSTHTVGLLHSQPRTSITRMKHSNYIIKRDEGFTFHDAYSWLLPRCATQTIGLA